MEYNSEKMRHSADTFINQQKLLSTRILIRYSNNELFKKIII